MNRIVIGGDFCPTAKTISENCFREISTIFRQADLRIVNFECAITDTQCIPIKKEGPVLQCTQEQFKQLLKTEANLVTLANNHILDLGEEGLKNVVSACENNGIQHVGVGKNIEYSKRTFFYQNIAIINCCEQEFSIADKDHHGANHASPISIYYQIQEARKKSNCVIVIFHGGIEYYQLPSPYTQDLYRFFIDAGATVVVGHHPHCYSGAEKYHNGYIYYSLGNLFFDNGSKEHTIWNNGFLLNLEINNEGAVVKNEIIPYIQCCGEVGIRILEGDDLIKFQSDFENLSKIIADRKELEEQYNTYCFHQQRKSLSRILPYSNKILVGLYKRGWIPSFLNPKMIISHLNAIRCESHRNILIKNLEAIYKKI